VLRFNIYQIVANVIAWIIIAPVLDIVIYAEPVNLVFTQGAIACLWNSIACAVIGTLLLFAYAKIRPKKGSLTKEAE
jgi:energy-coupling factor transport system substrate-specific component